jgi:hypothetical protein
MDWTFLLDPANGGPGEAPGYQETLARMKAQPYVKPADRPKPSNKKGSKRSPSKQK